MKGKDCRKGGSFFNLFYMWYDLFLEKNLAPDTLVRQAIRFYNKNHLKQLASGGASEHQARKLKVWETMAQNPKLAEDTDKANEQHYELPAAFFQAVLGPYLKYSCGYWRSGMSLEASEREMLEMTCLRAQLLDGQSILELGCGWGSLTLYMAQKFPNATITAVSNSHSQKAYIETQAQLRKLKNVRIKTADINEFTPGKRYDRIVSVEMFEHVRNYQALFQRLNTWLKPGAMLFVHIFAHKDHPYLFLDEHPRDWMARYFFTGGTMPSVDTLPHFAKDLTLLHQWWVNGQHYEKTSNAWLKNMDDQYAQLYPLFEDLYGKDSATKWWAYWRVFFMACAELFGHDQGQQWGVVHHLFQKPKNA